MVISFKNKEKSFQIILPSYVDIALANIYSFIAKRRREQLSCQLPPLRAEGSKYSIFHIPVKRKIFQLMQAAS